MLDYWDRGVVIMAVVACAYFLWQIHERLNQALHLMGAILDRLPPKPPSD